MLQYFLKLVLVNVPATKGSKQYLNAFCNKVVYRAVKEVCERYDVDVEIVYYWIGQYKKEGRLTGEQRVKNQLKYLLLN